MSQLKLKGPTQIVLNITNKCNMRCLYCFNSSREKNINGELSDKEIMKIISEIVTIRPYNVCFSGGEPLLRKNLLFECIEILSSNNIRTNIVSNGTLLNLETLQTLLKLGLQEIEISLDGSIPETHERFRSKGSFKKVIEALKNLRRIEFPAYVVSTVLNPFNWSEVRPMVELLKSLKTSSLIFRPMLLFGRAQHHREILLPTPLQYRKIYYQINRLEKSEKEIKIMYADPLSHIYRFSSNTPYFGMEIKANGDLIISPYIQLPLGNILRHSMEEYWNAGWTLAWQLPIIKELVKKIKNFSFEEFDAAVKQVGRFDLIDNV